MKVIRHKITDPYFNLALEEYLLRGCSDEYFMLWQNSPSIIVGKNQNTLAEINFDYVQRHSIPVVRRQSGGGAVFHDLGNINYTFICRGRESSFNDYAAFCRPVTEALRGMGIQARLSGRNDLLIDGKKFSGNAQCAYKDRLMHHGTLMFCANVGDMTQALNVNPLKIQSKGIKSVRSRVTNICEHLAQPMSTDEFCDRIIGQVLRDPGRRAYSLSEDYLAAARKLREEKYVTEQWNYGFKKEYSISKQSAFPCGFFDVGIDVSGGIISDIRIFGDYFGRLDAAVLEARLRGVPYTPQGLASALRGVEVGDFFAGLGERELLSMLM